MFWLCATLHVAMCLLAAAIISTLELVNCTTVCLPCCCAPPAVLMSHHPADNVELGTACGKLHRVSVLAITDAGELQICALCLTCCFKNSLRTEHTHTRGTAGLFHMCSTGTALASFEVWDKRITNAGVLFSQHTLSWSAWHAGDSDIIKANPTE